jgi:CRP-like cAMP-binding protein
MVIKVNESFYRESGSIAYVVKGLLKEYDSRARRKPAIVNLIADNSFIITTENNQSRYLKAVTESTIAYLDFENSFSLVITFRELKPIYDAALTNYEEGLNFRYYLLEERLVAKRIQQFIAKHRALLLYLKKKDMANYCNIPYDNFVRQYNKLL